MTNFSCVCISKIVRNRRQVLQNIKDYKHTSDATRLQHKASLGSESNALCDHRRFMSYENSALYTKTVLPKFSQYTAGLHAKRISKPGRRIYIG